MKQLVQVMDNFIVVGLYDRAFAGRLDVDKLIELEAPPQKQEDAPAQAVGDEEKQGLKHAANEANPNEIQAVAIGEPKDGLIYLAVTRYNKTLSVYKVDCNSLTPTASEEPFEKILPSIVHKTVKRACCLCFAEVPGQSIDVVIAGDLAGDAVAFPLSVSEQTMEEADEESNKNRHLLLGHTASMLTGAHAVKDGSISRILTSDRDEKVRVSSFPNTFVIEGYLLGHEAFVSSMSTATHNGVTRCATCSGDGTVRLWDYASCKELACCSVSEGELVPSRVALNPNGEDMVVLFDESPRIDCISISESNQLSTCTIECDTNTLSVAFVDNQKFVILATEPHFLMSYHLESNDATNKKVTPYKHAFCDTLSKFAQEASMITPKTVLEKDHHGQLKMKKENETRGPAQQLPWNKVERKEVARQRNARSRKRRRDKQDSDSA